MTSSWFRHQGAFQAILHDGFWQSDHDFLIASHINFLSGTHGFRDNEVALPTGYDVIMIYPLGSVLHRFCWRNLKERPKFHNHCSFTYFAYLLPFHFEVIRHFILACNCPFRPILVVFYDKTPPNFINTHFSSRIRSSSHQTASFELLWAKIGSCVWAVALLKNK